MSHQGNIHLGYNLVLLVQRLPPGTNDPDTDKRIAWLDVRRAIQAFAHWHLRVRFCKDTDKPAKSRRVSYIFQTLVHVDNFEPSATIKERLQKCNRPYIQVLIEPENDPRPLDELKAAVLAADPSAHVERFQIRPPINKSVDIVNGWLARPTCTGCAEVRGGAGIYHLASRICTAFVEYRPPWWVATQGAHVPNRFVPIDLNATFPRRSMSSVAAAGVVCKIMDIRDAVDLVCSGLDGAMHYFPPVPNHLQRIFSNDDTADSSVWTRYKFPFGIWFRGVPRICYDPEPSLFHPRCPEPSDMVHTGCDKRIDEQNVIFDECTMVHHYREYLPENRDRYGAMFDWLCLMQHHGAPTRLLDWTENILYALYFAVRDRNIDCDGVVWVLNAGRLNELTRVSSPRRYLCFPNTVDVHLRTAMAISHTWRELHWNLVKLGVWGQVKCFLDDAILKKMHQPTTDRSQRRIDTPADAPVSVAPGTLRLSGLEKLQYPVAVFPGRGNKRLAAQLGTFTLHGGKRYDPELPTQPRRQDRFQEPRSLVELNSRVIGEAGKGEGKGFLDAWIVPSEAKRKIREQLKRLGVHAGAVFPDLDSQSEYMKREWMIPVGRDYEMGS